MNRILIILMVIIEYKKYFFDNDLNLNNGVKSNEVKEDIKNSEKSEENYLFNNTLVDNYEILPIKVYEIEKVKLNIKKFEYTNLKDYFSLINAEKYHNEEKINKIIEIK